MTTVSIERPEAPLTLSADDVRKVLAGRKRAHRVLVTVPWLRARRTLPYEPYWIDGDGELLACDEYGDYHRAQDVLRHRVPEPGAIAWVREPWLPIAHGPDQVPRAVRIVFAGGGDDRIVVPPVPPGRRRWRIPPHARFGSLSAAMMPRWAARLLLRVTSVRIARLQALTEMQAIDEGCSARDAALVFHDNQVSRALSNTARGAALCEWDRRHADVAPAATNPWTWRIEFRRITG